MRVKAYTPSLQTFVPIVVSAPVIRLKAPHHTWGQSWLVAPTLRAVSAAHYLGGKPGRCELVIDYGATVKHVTGSSIVAQTPLPFRGWWVQIVLATETGTEIAWVGQVAEDARTVRYGASDPTGEQILVAYSPEYLLDKIAVSTAIWYRQEVPAVGDPIDHELTLDRVPPMNMLDDRGRLLGNRTDTVHGATTTRECYLYGERSLWSRRQYAEYLINRYVDQRADDGSGGPAWRLSGQVALLDELQDQVSWGEAPLTVGQMLRRVIDPQMGFDYRVRPMLSADGNLDGFEVYVHALGDTVTAFAGATMPANNLAVTVADTDMQTTPDIRVVGSETLRFAKIRIVGRPAVCVCTLRCTELGEADPSLVPKWPANLEVEYLAGAGGTASPAQQDLARQAERFHQVYRRFGAPVDWDHQRKVQPPVINAEGHLQVPFGDAENFQNVARKTLSWLPLLEGVDYTGSGGASHNDANNPPEYMGPQGWLYDSTLGGYVSLAAAGIGLSPLEDDWGVALHPNRLPHVVARNHWITPAPTEIDPIYDWLSLVVTIAFETDMRLALEWTDGSWSPGDPVKVISAADAELHYMVPVTVVGTDLYGGLVSYLGFEHLILRNDAERLYPRMAGAIARYGIPRAKAVVGTRDLRSWSDIVGAMMLTVANGSNVHDVNAVVTGVEWEFGGRSSSGPTENPQVSTRLTAGYV